MAFNINAHVILQGPKNIKAVTNSIKQQLAGISVPVNIQTGKASSASQQIGALNKGMKGLQASSATTSKGLKSVSQATARTATSLNKGAASAKGMGQSLKGAASQANQAAGAMKMLGRETALTFKRFAAAGIVTATVFRLGGAIAEATGQALEFQREMVKLEQITGKSAAQLGKLRTAVTSTSKQLGISANELAGIARLFSQTGQSIREVEQSMKAIARSSLAPTFGSMEQTAEGLIAALNQFGISASKAEQVLGSFNRVSKKFAVESSDLVAAVRRAGGVFALAAGQFKEPIQALQEFTAIFTAVRSTTRESAETIATGLRTIFTRLQRRGTIDMLKGLGIELTNTEGKFIGLYESFRVLSKELDKIIQKGDAVTLSAVTEELGGMRQVGKLIPAIREFKKAEAALKEAQTGAKEGLGPDVAKGLTPLIKQFEILGARFDDFIRKMADSRTFKQLASFAISTANAFISLGEAISPILPLLTQLAAMKIAKGAFAFGQGFFGSTKGMGGAGGLGARAGGMVAGKPTGGGGGAPTGAMSTNTSALAKNSAAISGFSKSIGGIGAKLSTSIANLTTAMRNLERQVSRSGGRRRGFNSGGLVPGRGNRDTVPAMLTPGEFVINKNSTSSIGAGNLAGVNRYAVGGKVRRNKGYYGFGPRQRRGASGGRGTPRPEAGRSYSNPTMDENRAMLDSKALAARSGKLRKDPKYGGRTDTDTGKMREVDRLSPAERKKYKSRIDAVTADDMTDVYGGAFLSPIGQGKDLVGTVNSGEVLTELKKHEGFNLLSTAKKDSDASKLTKDITSRAKKAMDFSFRARSLGKGVSENVEASIFSGVKQAMDLGSKQLSGSTRSGPITPNEEVGILRNANIDNVIGNVFEAILLRAGAPYSAKDRDAANAPFDFPTGLGSIAPNFGTGLESVATDAKTRYNASNIKTFLTKVKNQKADEFMVEVDSIFDSLSMDMKDFSTRTPQGAKSTNRQRAKTYQAKRQNRNTGGSIRGTGSDTVPAMLTPGEFVVNKKSSQSIGYGNLRDMNRYAAGGVVTRGRSHYGAFRGPSGVMGAQAAKTTTAALNAEKIAATQAGLSSLGEAAMGTALSSAFKTLLLCVICLYLSLESSTGLK